MCSIGHAVKRTDCTQVSRGFPEGGGRKWGGAPGGQGRPSGASVPRDPQWGHTAGTHVAQEAGRYPGAPGTPKTQTSNTCLSRVVGSRMRGPMEGGDRTSQGPQLPCSEHAVWPGTAIIVPILSARKQAQRVTTLASRACRPQSLSLLSPLPPPPGRWCWRHLSPFFLLLQDTLMIGQGCAGEGDTGLQRLQGLQGPSCHPFSRALGQRDRRRNTCSFQVALFHLLFINENWSLLRAPGGGLHTAWGLPGARGPGPPQQGQLGPAHGRDGT